MLHFRLLFFYYFLSPYFSVLLLPVVCKVVLYDHSDKTRPTHHQCDRTVGPEDGYIFFANEPTFVRQSAGKAGAIEIPTFYYSLNKFSTVGVVELHCA